MTPSHLNREDVMLSCSKENSETLVRAIASCATAFTLAACSQADEPKQLYFRIESARVLPATAETANLVCTDDQDGVLTGCCRIDPADGEKQ